MYKQLIRLSPRKCFISIFVCTNFTNLSKIIGKEQEKLTKHLFILGYKSLSNNLVLAGGNVEVSESSYVKSYLLFILEA